MTANAEFTGFRAVVSALAGAALAAKPQQAAAEPQAGKMAGAVPAGRLLLGDDAGQYPGLAAGFQRLAKAGTWRDAAGHSRDVYHPFVVHLHLAAFQKRYEALPAEVWSACEAEIPGAILPLRQVEMYADQAPPPEKTAMALWQALGLFEQAQALGRDVDVELVDSVVHQVVARRGEDGALHPQTREESLDAWTYRELTGLHALAGLALRRRNRSWAQRVQEVAQYHLENTQPDNTTTQPWALFAFFWTPRTRSLAQQQLHDVATQAGGAGIGVLAALLLADAANCLGEFG